MLIGIDGNEANVPNRVGIGRYALEVLKHIFYQQADANRQRDKQVIFSIYLKNPPMKDLPEETSFWKYKVVGPKPIWTQVGLPLSLYSAVKKPNVFFSPTHYAPRFSPVPTVISIMDLSFVHFPELFTEKDLHQLRHWTNYSVKQANKILTISKYSKEDIVRVYGINPEKVVVTYPGYDKQKFKLQNIKNKTARQNLAKKLGINKNYLLFVGTLQPRKNILSLIAAYCQLRESKKIPEAMQLVIAGKKGWLFDDIFKDVDRRHLAGKVVFTDYLSDNDLPELYQGAICFVLPSLYEGFGLTIVEAMASGVPVVVSSTSCLPEIIGHAGILVDPTDVNSIASGIYKVVGWKRDQREQMITLGLAQAKKFDWDKCAQLTLKTILSIG